jgi:uncharacterized protein (TIGR03437 family)
MPFGKHHPLALIVIVVACCSSSAQQYTISTVAGGAPPPNAASALTVGIGLPTGVAADAAGNIYFSTLNYVFKVDPAGTFTRLAGGARGGYSGDGGPAVNAQMNGAFGVAVDAAGNVFIADFGNNRVRKVSVNGTISTVAGTGQVGFGFSGDGGPAIAAQLDHPSAVAVDGAGNLFIADTSNFRIRKVAIDGTITTVAGNGRGYGGDGGSAVNAQLANPQGIAIDSSGNLFIADVRNNRVRKVDASGIITTVAGNGQQGYSGDGATAVNAQLNRPQSVVVDAAGNLFIADSCNTRIRKVTPAGLITTIAGTGQAGYSGDGGSASSAQLNVPSAITLDAAGNLLIADNNNSRIRKMTPAGSMTTVAGNGQYGYSGDSGPSTSAQLFNPYGVAIDAAGNLLIADSGNNNVRKVSAAGIITTATGASVTGSGACCPYLLRGVGSDSGGSLFITDAAHGQVRRVAANGSSAVVAGIGQQGYAGDGGLATSAQLNSPNAVTVDAAGNLYITDQGNNRIRKVSTTGVISTAAGNGQFGNSGDGGLATSAQLNLSCSYQCGGVALDAQGNLLFADYGNHRIRKVSTNGVISTVAGNGNPGFGGDGGSATAASLYYPASVALDAAGNLYIADNGNGVIRKVSPGGTISTIAGNGEGGYAGDGGPAIYAEFNNPSCVAVDAAGNVYVADSFNSAIRMLTPIQGSSPVIPANSVVDGAAYRGSVAPGGIASVFGTNLSASTANSAALPLTTTLGGTTLTLGGKAVPLFYVSPTQIDFQVPWELAGTTQASIVAGTAGGTTAPQAASVSVASPGIFTDDSSGRGPGVVTITATGQPVTAATPAPRGQYITIYCSGLGPVSNQPATGAAAPFGQVSNTTLTPNVTIGGGPATTVQFSGLTPGFVGLYQVNVLVPVGTTPGPAVPILVTIGGVSSNTVTIAVL